jgi:hypothetical protein
MRVIAIAYTHPIEELTSADALVPDLAHLDVQSTPSGLTVAILP